MRASIKYLLSCLTRQAVYAPALLACLAAPTVAQSTLQFVPVISNYGGLAATVCSASTDAVGDGCLATQAKFAGIVGSVTDGAGNLYLSDGNLIRRIDAATRVITLVAGGATTVCPAATDTVGDGCPAMQANFNGPKGVKFDPFGNLIIADSNNHRIRSLNLQTGIVTTIAGNGAAATAVPSNTFPVASNLTPLSFPYDTAFDVQGNMYIVNYKGVSFVSVVAAIQRAIVPGSSLAYTVAGTGTNGVQGVPGPATAGQVSGPHGFDIDAAGNLYVACYTDNTVRKITSSLVDGKLIIGGSTMTILAGQSGVAAVAGPESGDGGQSTTSTLAGIQSVALDKAGNVYIMQATSAVNRVSKIDLQGIITTYAGSAGTRDNTGIVGANGPALSAQLGGPTWGNFDTLGHLYVTGSYSNAVYAISPNSRFPQENIGVTSPSQKISIQGKQAGTLAAPVIAPATSTDFVIGTLAGCAGGQTINLNSYCQIPITFKPTLPGLRTAQLVISDIKSNITVIGLNGIGSAPEVLFGGATLSTVAGTGTAGNTNPTGPAISAQLNAPRGGAFDASGNLYFADSGNHEIRRIDAVTGTISTVAGTGTAGFSGDSGTASAAQLNTPKDVVLDAAGNLYIADSGNQRIRYIDFVTGIITTIAGTGTAAYIGDGGPATAAALSDPQGLALDGAGEVYFADAGNHVLRKFYPSGPITTFAGTGTAGYAGDGGPAAYSQLNSPADLAFDLVGNLYVADAGNSVVRKISTLGQISTYAGKQGNSQNSGDGAAATAATLQNPSALATDPAGDLYIACGGVTRMVDTTGTIITVAGTDASGPYTGEGSAATSAVIPTPVSNLALDSSANLYLFATAANRVLKVASATPPALTFIQPKASSASDPQSLAIQNAGNSPLTLSDISLSTGFTLESSEPNACTPITVLSPGSSCALSIVFSSAASGVFRGTLTLTDNALNDATSTQVIALSGIAGAITSTTTTLAITPLTAIYGSPVTLKATISGKPVPTGTVTFTANGNSLGDATLANGVASLTLKTLDVGGYSIVAAYQGDSNNAPSSSTGSTLLSITPATLTVTAASTTRQGGDANPTFTYTFTGFMNAETASVVSGVPLETTTATPASPVGPYTITIDKGTLSATNYIFTFVNGTLTVTTPIPDFAFSSTATNMTLPSGQSGATTLTLTPLHTYTGTVTLKCSNVPANVVCTFNTTQFVTDSTGTPQSTQLTIGTNSLSQIAGATRPGIWGDRMQVLSAINLPLFSVGIFLVGRRKRMKLATLLSLTLLTLLPIFTIGCSSPPDKAFAAPGTYNITVTASDSTHSISHDVTIALIVN